ncbi:MAG TPA: hypothetical protein PLO51_02875, partial [Candidatus Micrarchaeota archaeon]|nr:hypothetical protein [Candidatus Micrarchaeota archaeon]
IGTELETMPPAMKTKQANDFYGQMQDGGNGLKSAQLREALLAEIEKLSPTAGGKVKGAILIAPSTAKLDERGLAAYYGVATAFVKSLESIQDAKMQEGFASVFSIMALTTNSDNFYDNASCCTSMVDGASRFAAAVQESILKAANAFVSKSSGDSRASYLNWLGFFISGRENDAYMQTNMEKICFQIAELKTLPGMTMEFTNKFKATLKYTAVEDYISKIGDSDMREIAGAAFGNLKSDKSATEENVRQMGMVLEGIMKLDKASAMNCLYGLANLCAISNNPKQAYDLGKFLDEVNKAGGIAQAKGRVAYAEGLCNDVSAYADSMKKRLGQK